MKRNFIKWFITTGVIATAATIAQIQGVFSLILQNDVSYLSGGIMTLFVIASGLAGALAYGLDDPAYRTKKAATQYSEPKLKVLNYFSELFFALGLLGTIIGFCFMMHNTLGAEQDVMKIIAELKAGVSTALYTTLVGMCASLGLQLQVFLIENRQ